MNETMPINLSRLKFLVPTLFALGSMSAYLSSGIAQDGTFQVTVAPAKAVDYAPHIRAFGVVQSDPTRVSTLVSMVGGVVQRVGVRPGQTVSNGDTPVTLLTDPAARTQVVQARDAIRLAEETLQRVQPLFEKGLVQKAEVDNAQRDLGDAKARLEELRQTGAMGAEVSPAAPADGLVTDVLVQVGDQVAAGAALIRAADPLALSVRIGVEAADVRSLPLGTPVKLTAITGLEAGDPEPPSTIAAITAIERIVDPQTRLVPVSATFSGSAAGGFLIDQAVQARFEMPKQSAIAVPRAALLYEGKTPIVFVDDNGKAARREVSIIEAAEDQVYLDAGIKAGESVVTSGQTGLQEGALLRVIH